MDEYVNYYGVEKYYNYRECEMYLFIPYEYKEGTYKLEDIDYIKCYSDEFIGYDDEKKREMLNNYMLWIGTGLYISNGFSNISVTDVNRLEITYKKTDNKDKGMLWQVVNCDNRDDFYRYVENDSKIFDEIIGDCAKNICEEISNKLKAEYSEREIRKLFLDFFGDYEAPVINCTIVCEDNIQKVRNKYSYKKYINKKYSGVNILKRFISHREDYDKYIEDILSNSGEYNECVYELKNVDKIFSYYASLFEYDYFKNDNNCSEFLNLVCNRAREMLIDDLDLFNVSKDFKFYDIEEWD